MGNVIKLLSSLDSTEEEVLEALNQDFLDDRGKTEALLLSVSRNFQIMTVKLIEKGANIFCLDAQENSLLHYAAAAKNEYMVDLLIKEGVSNVNFENNNFQTPLTIAAIKGNEIIFDLMLRYNPIPANLKRTLIICMVKGNIALVEKIINLKLSLEKDLIIDSLIIALATKLGNNKILGLLLNCLNSKLEKDNYNKITNDAMQFSKRYNLSQLATIINKEYNLNLASIIKAN